MSGGGPKRRYVRFTRWRRRRFFALLAESGNVRMACELSGVGLGCIYRLRRTEPGFVALMAEAVEKANGVLRDAGSPACAGAGCSPAPQDERSAAPRLPSFSHPAAPGAALLRGGSLDRPGDDPAAAIPEAGEGDLVIRRGRGGRLRVMAAGTRWWAARADAVFLGHLRMTGNVAASARAAGFTPKSAWNRRGRMPSFARAWDAALEEAEHRLNGRLAAEALKGTWAMEPGAFEAPEPETFDVDQALRLLTYWERQRSGRHRRGGRGAFGEG